MRADDPGRTEELAMPYHSNAELPDSVKDHLPKHAQDIYREAYNSAWDEYKDPDRRRGDAGVDAITTRVYAQIPDVLVRLARETVSAHLAKLEREGRVGRTGESWHMIGP